MFREPVLIAAVVLLTSIQIHAQSSALRTAVPAPTAASLGQCGDPDVNLYTGKPSISIPIYQAKSRDLGVAISLSYNASGFLALSKTSFSTILGTLGGNGHCNDRHKLQSGG